MTHTLPRHTLAKEAVFEGRCLHGGQNVRLVVRPGDDGIAFHYGTERIPAIPSNVADTSRCTRLGPISTVEHLMAAFAALGITDSEVEVDQPELPAMDGCSETYLKGLESTGTEEIGTLVIDGPFARVFAAEGMAKVAIASGTGHWRYTFDATPMFPGIVDIEFLDVVDAFSREVAGARTFGFESEIPALLAAGMARGLDLSQALVIGADAYVNEPRSPDEPARHKILDLMGDTYLSGIPPSLLNVSAERSGHRLNVEAAAKLSEAVRVERLS